MKGDQIISENDASTLNRVVEELDYSMTELRRIARNMMPEALVKFGLKDALEDYCGHIREVSGMEVHFQAYGMQARLPQQVELIFFRLVQELLNNILRHAAATEAMVQLLRDGNRLNLTVEDNGRGFDPALLEKAPGIGWLNIRSRVKYLNGQLELHSLPGKGTSVNIECTLP
ncbi:MAG: hypothetical protein D6730_21035 [Bacteroidetes bacterium]|nr:MAG: hypothetical protein D6730_21035 [Bacteroidota bacterium]